MPLSRCARPVYTNIRDRYHADVPPPAPATPFGRNLLAYRRRLGLNQTEFGEVIGFTQSRLSLWERGRRQPRARDLSQVAGRLQVSVDQLLHETLDVFPLATTGARHEAETAAARLLRARNQRDKAVARQIQDVVTTLTTIVRMLDQDAAVTLRLPRRGAP